ncbi:MAG: hypothetical protein Ct9H300mP28_06720 [Pseudomonadota bacterium]|nr:MAG: hypothetical protein Ct9H300mP28_06720 [Pseudomonadota bacterium]
MLQWNRFLLPPCYSYRCEVWAPTQLQDGAMMVAMGVTELPQKKFVFTQLTLEEALDERLTLIISLLHWWPPRY